MFLTIITVEQKLIGKCRLMSSRINNMKNYYWNKKEVQTIMKKDNCTAMLVGKDASIDGSTMIARDEDGYGGINEKVLW